MAQWLDQTLNISQDFRIELKADSIWIGCNGLQLRPHGYAAKLCPSTKDEAVKMAIALRLAYKRMEKMAEDLP